MVVADKPRHLIVLTAGHFFGTSVEQTEGDFEDREILDRFLEQSSCRTLCARPVDENRNRLKLTTELPAGRNTLVFFKVTAAAITEENFHDVVQVASTGCGDSTVLIEGLRQVWTPTLESSGLNTSCLRKLEEKLLSSGFSTTVEEEEEYWRRKKDEVKRSHERAICDEAVKLTKNIRIELAGAAASRDGLIAVEEACEAISVFVDDLWKLGGPAYTEERMKSFLDVIGNELVKLIQSYFDTVGVTDARAKDEAIALGATVCDKWVNVTQKLTELFWPHHSLHPWRGAIFVPEKCSKFGKNLRQISELRAQHRQLSRLLTPGERSGLGIDALLQTLDDTKVALNDERDGEWERLRSKIEEGLAPAEERVAQKLKNHIADADTPSALVAEFARYSELIKREKLKRALRGERESLLSAYRDLIENRLAGPDTENLLDVPRVLQEIQAARSAEVRLESLAKLGKELLTDLPGYEEVAARLSSALKEAEDKKQDLIESWVTNTRNDITKKELSLGTDSPVVELTGTSMMRVTYDPRLMTLIREARALSGEGIELPREIRELVDRAASLAGRARALQQVATFHNTIGDRMVPSQRPLMLTIALELARAVQEQSGVVWSDPHLVDVYTARLKELVVKFARQNSELISKHSTLRDYASNLLKGDAVHLVGNQNIWKETLTNMRAIVDAVDSEYGNARAWKLHWDRQLLKALSVAYRNALPSLSRKLSEIRVELTFRDGSLQWRPPLEDIRAKLYSGIRRSLSIPINFRGVGDVADAHFGDLVQKNAYLFSGVYKQIEIVLSTLESFRAKWLSLATPANIDVGEQLKGKPPQEWAKAFKEAKQWAQEVGKLRGCDVKISCVCVDTATTRNDLETASRRYWERLCSDLRTEASSRLMAVVDFLSFASKELERRPRDVEEVGLAHEAHARIEQQSAGIADEMEAVAVLAKVMAAWTSEKLDGVGAAHAAWQELGDRLEKHKAVMARLLEDAKVNLRHKAIALRDERERWQAKWSSRSENITLDWLMLMKERWINLQEQTNSLKLDCKRIALDLESVLEDDEINMSQLERELESEESNYRFQSEFLEELRNQETEEWAVARRRLPRLHDWLDSWENKLRLENGHDEVNTFAGKKINEVRAAIEAIQLLRGDELAEEHWTELIPILGLKVENPRDITLGHVLACTKVLKNNEDKIKAITKRAIAESGIRQALMDLEIWESTASLPMQESTDSKNMTILIVGDYGGLLAKIEELRLLLEGAKGTSGHDRFVSRVARCEAALSELEEKIKILGVVQRKWIYLDPVYGSGAAPNDSGRWPRADKEFRYLMAEVSRDPKIPSLRQFSLSALTNLKDLLDRCQKSLDEFLEEKRTAYPRLYFLSDEDLLELISGSTRGLEAHLPKLYHGVGSVVRENNTLTAIVSPEGEALKLPEAIDLAEPLPRWLDNLESGMKNALRQSLEKCLNDSTPDPSVYPTQILLFAERIRFTDRCERALKGGHAALQKLVEFLETQRARYRGLEDAGDKLTALKARNLLLDTVHHLQAARTLLRIVATGENAGWIWHKQLKSYRTNQGTYVVRCAGAELPYRFEYQGASIGLVRTPLTERCFLALMQAMKLGLGGSPTGPAGTGKTESVKALASILGRPVLVFNCDEGMDTGSMRRILGGLAQAGAWGCFDEFNRLEEGTLSAVAMLVRPLQEALRNGSPEILLGDQKVKLNPHCCIFITMNPAGTEYGGRRKLPDSLARLFRPISMAHPDKLDIVRTLLECAGFLEAATLGKRLVEALDIAGTMLTEQPHYDWGLRALKSVLDALRPIAGADETTRLLVSIKASTLPKLTEADTVKFLSLLDDLFPKTNSSDSTENEDLVIALLKVCDTRGLTKEIANRCIQLNDLLKSRTGVAIVGPAGSGKTSIRSCLAEAMTKIGKPVSQIIVHPGAMPKRRLLGYVNPRTREWREGVLSSTIMSAGNSATWIIFNGDVEPEWAEALNSALDDNRLLTLPNGIGVKLGSGTRFIFETHKLAGASPATVSRLGVLHLGSTKSTSLMVPWRLEQLSPTAAETVNAHLCSCIDETLKINADGSSAAGLMSAALCHLCRAETFTQTTHALLASLCSHIKDPQSRDNLAKFIYGSTDGWCPDPQRPNAVLYDRETDRLVPYSDTYESVDSDYGPVSISDRVRKALAAILPWIEDGHPVMIRGSQASGKNVLIDLALSRIKNHETVSVVRGSSLYGIDDLVTRLKKACLRLESSSQGRTYKPKNGSRVLLVLEDMHLAAKDLQELVRELIQEEEFLEEDLIFSKVSLTVICTADASTQLHPRLEALFATCYLEHPSQKEIAVILELHLRTSLKEMDRVMAESWIVLMKPNILEAFRFAYSAQESSFVWSLKDFVLWAMSLRYYPTPENEADITRYLLDIGQRLFRARLTTKSLMRWESLFLSKQFEVKDCDDDVYVWRSTNNGLYPLSKEQWREEIITTAARCAREGQPIQTSISSYLLETVAGLTWAIGCNFRGVILVGRPGAGRRSAVKLVATFASFRLIDSGPERGKMAIKNAVQSAGVEGQPVLLLLEEHHAREETLAVLVSAVVSKGEIPELFTAEELETLVAPLADLARREDFQGTLEQYLYHRLRKYLRVVVILDSEDIESSWFLRLGLLRYCALLGPGSSEWWSSERSLIDLAVQEGTLQLHEDEDAPAGAKIILEAHLQAPRCQKAPARFLALIHTWKHLRDTWSKEIEEKLQVLEAGIGKLGEAGEQVAKLEDEVSRQRQELEVEKGRANAALEQITATMRGATNQRGEMTNLKAKTERESTELARRKADIESELGKVEPLVEQAAQAVAGISADALAEVRSLRAPPAPVRDVLEGVLRLMGIKDTSWNSMKTFLAKRGIKDEIRNWDARRSTSVSLEAVAKLIKERPESFEEKTAKRASIAAAPLAAWVLANLQYGQILEQVAPLEREQRQLAGRLAAAETQLGELSAGLNTVESRVAQLQKELAERTRGAAELQLRAEATEASLSTARALLQKLDTEHRDWQSQYQELTARKERLDIETANAAALLAYQDPKRDDTWQKVAIKLLVTERERLQWRAQGLPADTSSLVAASRVLKGPLVPIFLDPSGVAVSWIKRSIGSRLEVTQPENSKFLTTVELAVRFGKPLLIEELVEFPTVLLPVLRRKPLRLGDRTLPAQQGFQLFLATRKDRMEDIPKEADAVLCHIALGAGTKSLTERFVEKLLLSETPELEAQRREALEREERLSGERDAARLELLSQLATARGQDLLQESQEEGGLLFSLEATQSKAKEITAALERSRQNLNEVSKRAKDHEKFARFAANVYETIRGTTSLSSLYVISAEAYTDILLKAVQVDSSSSEDDREKKNSLIEKRLIILTYHHCAKAIYRKHRLPLALHMALSLNPVSEIERNFLFDKGGIGGTDNSDFELPEWIPDERCDAVRALGSLLPNVAARIKPSWLKDISGIFADSELSPFQKVLVVKALRPDYLHTALSTFAAKQLGAKSLAPPLWTLSTIAQEKEGSYPVLLLLSPGADPGPELGALATKHAAAGFTEVSLGQGHVAQAEQALETACRHGSWILLSNLQLALNWLPRLESLLRSPICTTNKNPSARIWLTTEECSGFYPGLAGLCLKLAYEPPEGVKRNMRKSLQQFRQSQRNDDVSAAVLVLSWLHATLQERRNFVPQGWIKSYEWNESDFEAAYELVVKETTRERQSQQEGDWQIGRGLLDVAVYGGRLQDDYDARALRSMIRDVWSRDVFDGRRKLGNALKITDTVLGDPIKSLENLDDVDSPKEYFGLPANAYRAWERAAAENALTYLECISMKFLNGKERSGKKSREKSKVQRDLKELVERQCSQTFASDAISEQKRNPLQDFFIDEINLTRKLLNVVQTDVNASSFEDSEIPKHWHEEWRTGSKNALQFAKALLSRYETLKTLAMGVPRRVDLSQLSRPRALLTALKQYTARELGYPLETLELRANWVENRAKKEWKISIQLEGLLISGASIEDGVLKDLDADSAAVALAPICQVAFIPEEYSEDKSGGDNPSSLEDTYRQDYLSIPVYTSVQREALICSLPITCLREERAAWLRRGVILYLK